LSIRSVTDEEVAIFQENGWVRLRSLVDTQTVAALLQLAEEKMAAEKTARTYGNAVDRSFRDFPGIDRNAPLARDVTLAPVMGRSMARMLGVRNVRVLIDGFLVKMPERQGAHAETVFHQDFPGHPVDRSGFLTVWLALHDMPVDAGLVQFYNRSHTQGSHGWVFADGVDLRRRCTGLKTADLSLPAAMKGGDATLHHSLTVHGAAPNVTADNRWAYTVIYMDPDTRYNGAQGEFRGSKVAPYAVLDQAEFPLVPMS
jgi:hypothetical protein